MQIDLSSDRFMTALTGITLAGMALATVDAFLSPSLWGPVGLVLVYLAGGVPTGVRALTSLWRERILDIDLIMIVAALAAAAVGATLEGAVLLTLFSLSTTLEQRAMGRARHAVEALMARWRKAKARSMRRRSPANRCRSAKAPAQRCSRPR